MSTICIVKNILKNKGKRNIHISEDEIFKYLPMHARVNDIMCIPECVLVYKCVQKKNQSDGHPSWRFTVLKLCGQTNCRVS